jgi:mannose-6-phosphate isomerase
LSVDASREILVACRHFALERWRINETKTMCGDGQTCRIVTVLSGTLAIDAEEYAPGTSIVLPADLVATRISGDAEVLVGYVPDLDADVVTPLRATGYSDTLIRSLGIDIR